MHISKYINIILNFSNFEKVTKINDNLLKFQPKFKTALVSLSKVDILFYRQVLNIKKEKEQISKLHACTKALAQMQSHHALQNILCIGENDF